MYLSYANYIIYFSLSINAENTLTEKKGDTSFVIRP